MSTALILVADDFGATKGINSAVSQLHKLGVLDAAAMMTQGREFLEAISICDSNPNLRIGLHLVLTDERSEREYDWLDSSAKFPNRRTLLSKLFVREISAFDIRNEIEAQIRMIEDHGIKVTFINGHQHVHTLPYVARVVADVARERDLYVRIPTASRLQCSPKKLFMQCFAKILRYYAKQRGVQVNDVLVSNFDLPSRTFDIDSTLGLLKDIAGESIIYEYMIHPSSEITGLEHYWYVNPLHIAERLQEYETWQTDAVIDAVQSFRRPWSSMPTK
jgi:predicted glycoside hydrolase/deacetylase ChbG (UPF0249 family)